MWIIHTTWHKDCRRLFEQIGSNYAKNKSLIDELLTAFFSWSVNLTDWIFIATIN